MTQEYKRYARQFNVILPSKIRAKVEEDEEGDWIINVYEFPRFFSRRRNPVFIAQLYIEEDSWFLGGELGGLSENYTNGYTTQQILEALKEVKHIL